MDKKRVTFYLRPETDEKLSRMARLLGEPKSTLLDELINEAADGFFKIVGDGKSFSVSRIFDVLSDKLKELGDTFERTDNGKK